MTDLPSNLPSLPSKLDGTPSVLPSVPIRGRKTEPDDELRPNGDGSEPWDTATPPQPNPRPDTPQPDTCTRCGANILTARLHGLRVTLNPTPATPQQQAAAILTQTTMFAITTHPTLRNQPLRVQWISPALRARRLIGQPSSPLDHPHAPTHLTHRC